MDRLLGIMIEASEVMIERYSKRLLSRIWMPRGRMNLIRRIMSRCRGERHG